MDNDALLKKLEAIEATVQHLHTLAMFEIATVQAKQNLLLETLASVYGNDPTVLKNLGDDAIHQATVKAYESIQANHERFSAAVAFAELPVPPKAHFS